MQSRELQLSTDFVNLITVSWVTLPKVLDIWLSYESLQDLPDESILHKLH